MKKFLFIILILLIAAGFIYKSNVKPEVHAVVKPVKLNAEPDVNKAPPLTTNAPPAQNVPK
jgi:hypothetical protein